MALRYKKHGASVYKSKRWKALRLEAKRRDNFQCVKCGAKSRLEVDHIRPIRDYSEGAYQLSNLQTLCAKCHTQKTRVECGHPPKSPERLKWEALVNDLRKRTF